MKPTFIARNAGLISSVFASDFRDIAGVPIRSPREHLDETVRWLLCAHAETGEQGVAHSFSLLSGWGDAYPETTGYIIPTVWSWADRRDAAAAARQARRMASWLLELQDRDGWFPAGTWRRGAPVRPSVFNTGQILFGLVSAYERTGDSAFLESASAAARWLVGVQDADGAWRQHVYKNAVHSYEARVAWPLVLVGRAAGDEAIVDAARRNLAFTLSLARPDGWWSGASFSASGQSFLHTIAYTIEAVLEAGLLLQSQPLADAARRTADALLQRQLPDGSLAGAYDERWVGTSYRCLTGIAQMALVWGRLYEVTGGAGYRTGLHAANRYLMACQTLTGVAPELRGALAGSRPVWGRYMALRFPNWAAKFFADSLLIEEAIETPTPAPS